MKLDHADPNFNEEEYRKILKTRNQNMVKLQRYRVAKQIERMQPSIHFMEEGKKNVQVLFADNETEVKKIKEKENKKGLRESDDEDEEETLGKRLPFLEEVILVNIGWKLFDRGRCQRKSNRD